MSKEKAENLLDVNIEQMETGDLKDDKAYKEKQKKYILKGISSIFSCIIHTSGYYSVFTLAHTLVYLISFRRHYNPNLTFSHGYFLWPIKNLVLSLTVTIGGIIEKKIGAKKTIFLSSLILCLSFVVMFFSRNLLIDYILWGFIGFGVALGIKLSKRNACSFFMNRKALISGIVTLVPSFISAGLAVFNEKYILNPLGESPTIENSYYEERIFLNYQKLIIFEIGFLILTCILSLATFFKNDPKETIKYGFGEKVIENKSTEIEKRKESIDNQELKKSQVQKALYSSRSVKLFFIIFLLFPTINFINNTWRPIGIYYKIRTRSLQIVGALFSITGCLSSITFSLIGDKIQFRYIICSFGIILTLTSFAFPLSFNNEVLFVVEILAVAFSFNGFNVIIDPHLMKVFGMENFVEICGVIRASSGISEIVSVILAFYLENYFTGSKDYAYKWMYLISGFSGLISFVLSLFETDEKFNYNN